MPAAARVGDITAHGSTPITPFIPGMGSPNVFIGGKQAWRALLDVHRCPLFNGPSPHVGGMVTKGSISVFINGLSAVRQGDKIVEAGGPNEILSGELRVMIGG